jgi:hypothetical protein
VKRPLLSVTFVDVETGERSTPLQCSTVNASRDRITVGGYPLYHGGPIGWDVRPDGALDVPATKRVTKIEIEVVQW